MRTGFNRRRLLYTLCGVILAPRLAGATARKLGADAATLEDALRSLGAASRLPREIRRLGERFGVNRARAGEPNHLLEELRASPRTLTAAEVARCFVRRRADDFAHDHLVVANGWVLARAEAELCELLAQAG